jgi:hypothetical protein
MKSKLRLLLLLLLLFLLLFFLLPPSSFFLPPLCSSFLLQVIDYLDMDVQSAELEVLCLFFFFCRARWEVPAVGYCLFKSMCFICPQVGTGILLGRQVYAYVLEYAYVLVPTQWQSAGETGAQCAWRCRVADVC